MSGLARPTGVRFVHFVHFVSWRLLIPFARACHSYLKK